MAWPIAPEVWLPFLAAVSLVELTPGPNMGYLAALAAERGRRAGLAAVAGVTVGLAVYMAASIFGVTEVFAAWRPAYEALRWAGVAYLLWLAFDGWRGADSGPEAAPSGLNAGEFFRRGLLANLLNPKAALFYVVLLPGFIRPDHGPPVVQAAILGLTHLAVSIVIHGLIVLGAARAGVLIASAAGEERLAWVRRGLALAIAAVAVWLAWQTRS